MASREALHGLGGLLVNHGHFTQVTSTGIICIIMWLISCTACFSLHADYSLGHIPGPYFYLYIYLFRVGTTFKDTGNRESARYPWIFYHSHPSPHRVTLVACRPRTTAAAISCTPSRHCVLNMPTLASPARGAQPSSPIRYVRSPLRSVMLQSEVPPYERSPSARPSMHTRCARHSAANVSFQEAMHAVIGSSSPVELLSRGSQQPSPPVRTPRKTLPSSESRMPVVSDTAPSKISHKDNTQTPLNKHLPKAQELKGKRPTKPRPTVTLES